MMRFFFTVIVCSIAAIAYGQQSARFDIEEFNRKWKTAEWLCQYDMVAWITSDSVMVQDEGELARLGKEWFCFQEGEIWHAVYGKYDNGYFDLVFHFTIDGGGNCSRTNAAVDTSLLHRYSRALQTANQEIQSLQDTVNLRFNQYIRENEDQTLSVWIFPAFQPSGIAVYGGEFIYLIDPAGKTILQDDSYYQGQFRGFKTNPPREIWLGYTEVSSPTLGSVFFVWYYKEYFTKIVIDNANSISTPILSNGDWVWIHSEKQPEKKRKKKRK